LVCPQFFNPEHNQTCVGISGVKPFLLLYKSTPFDISFEKYVS